MGTLSDANVLFWVFFSKGRAEYASYLKEHSNMERLLSHLFRLMLMVCFGFFSPREEQTEYASYLKKHSNMERLLSHLFRLMLMFCFGFFFPREEQSMPPTSRSIPTWSVCYPTCFV